MCNPRKYHYTTIKLSQNNPDFSRQQFHHNVTSEKMMYCYPSSNNNSELCQQGHQYMEQ